MLPRGEGKGPWLTLFMIHDVSIPTLGQHVGMRHILSKPIDIRVTTNDQQQLSLQPRTTTAAETWLVMRAAAPLDVTASISSTMFIL